MYEDEPKDGSAGHGGTEETEQTALQQDSTESLSAAFCGVGDLSNATQLCKTLIRPAGG